MYIHKHTHAHSDTFISCYLLLPRLALTIPCAHTPLYARVILTHPLSLNSSIISSKPAYEILLPLIPWHALASWDYILEVCVCLIIKWVPQNFELYIFVFPMYIKMSGKELAFNKCALKLTQSTLAKAQVRNFKQQPALNTRYWMKEAYVIQLVLIFHLHNDNWTILYNSPASIPY